MRFSKNTSLFVQVFVMFWLAILCIGIVITVVPNLDPRNQKDVPENAQRFLKKQARTITALYSKKKMDSETFYRLNARTMRMFDTKVFFTDLQGNLLFMPYRSNRNGKSGREHDERRHRDQQKQIKKFVLLAEDFENPQEIRFFDWRYSGPFLGTLNDKQVRIYFARSEKDTPFFFRFLDNPFELLALIMLASTPILLILTWRLTIPARKLQQAANRVATGNFEVDKALETGTKEFQQTGASFNQMVMAIKQMITGQQRLLSDISHELRSPLTRLRMATSLAVRKQGESSELQRIDLEAERLEQMISELLSLSRMQLNSHQEIEETNLETLWLELLKDAHFEAAQLDKELHWDGLHKHIIQGNAKLLMSALENVIRNAVKYAQHNVIIQFSIQQHQLQITVDDDGIGVPEGERELIFKPFYRVSTARDRTTGGTGLGLAITESTISQHLGKVEALQSPQGGLRIKIELPLKKLQGE